MPASPADQSAGDRIKFESLDDLRAPAPPSMSETGADAGSEVPVNPRKRKKASRAYVTVIINSRCAYLSRESRISHT
jgi:hypothetical protein